MTIPETYPPSDSFILGRTQESSGSEVQAGARAELWPTPLTLALASFRGRAMGRTMIAAANTGAINFTRLRIPMLHQAILQTLPAENEAPTIVITAVGFSPLGFMLAEALTKAAIIEVDLPEVLRQRQRRLRRAQIEIPTNLRMIPAILREQPLAEVLNGQQVDIINFTGAYFTPDQLQHVLGYLRPLLNENGACVYYLPWEPAIRANMAASRFFMNIIGKVPGVIKNEAAASSVCQSAGYSPAQLLFPTALKHSLPGEADTDLIDTEVLVVARQAKIDA